MELYDIVKFLDRRAVIVLYDYDDSSTIIEFLEGDMGWSRDSNSVAAAYLPVGYKSVGTDKYWCARTYQLQPVYGEKIITSPELYSIWN